MKSFFILVLCMASSLIYGQAQPDLTIGTFLSFDSSDPCNPYGEVGILNAGQASAPSYQVDVYIKETNGTMDEKIFSLTAPANQAPNAEVTLTFSTIDIENAVNNAFGYDGTNGFTVYMVIDPNLAVDESDDINNTHDLGNVTCTIGGSPTSVAEMNNSENNLSIYPNPTKDVITIQLEDMPLEGAVLNILDLSGKVYHTELINTVNQEVSLEKLPQGVYWINIQMENQIFNEKVIKL